MCLFSQHCMSLDYRSKYLAVHTLPLIGAGGRTGSRAPCKRTNP